ncbi:NUDIX domain-containing protein [Hwanghaeella sp.]|uniref:NUDIX domain-containing protein n=1 Tax=Hwanghaeella sp. TaxID=2605943 RepID=UPI003CCBA295
MNMPDIVEITSRERAFDGFFKMDVFTLRFELFRGGMSPEIEREVLIMNQSICCLPYDPVRDEVVLVEQFRTGPFAAGEERPWMLEAPAGFMEAGEDATQTATREVHEEAGCAVTALDYTGPFYTSQGALSERTHVFIGRAETAGVGGIHGVESEGENIRVSVFSFDAAAALMNEGKIRSAFGVVPLLWLSRHRERLRREWHAP